MRPVAAMPLERMNDVSPVLLNGAYIAGNGDAVVRRATDPAQRAQTRLIIQNGYTASLENAYYDFMAARGDVEATLTDFGGDLVQSLLGKSQEVDIYCADAQLPAYEAALSRGYLPAIEDEAVQAFVDRCYPFVREVCMRDGEAVAVPTGMVLRTRLGCNEELLGALGMAREELPATWPDFFASLEGLSRRVEAIPGATLFESGEDWKACGRRCSPHCSTIASPPSPARRTAMPSTPPPCAPRSRPSRPSRGKRLSLKRAMGKEKRRPMAK